MNYPWISKANRIFSGVLVAQFLLSLFIAFFTQTWFEAIVIGLFTLSLPLVLIKSAPQSPITRCSVGVAVQVFAALHIQQTMGLTELHFEIFVMLAFLSFYRDWKVILASAGFVAIHHVLFFAMQVQGSNVFIFEEGHLLFYILMIHALFAIVEAGVLMYVAKHSHREAVAAHDLSSSVKTILANNGKFDLASYQPSDSKQLADFNKLISSFSSLITQSKQVSDSVAKMADEVAGLTSQAQNASEDNANQINLIATAAEEMTVASGNVSGQVASANDNANDAFINTDKTRAIIESSGQNIDALTQELADTSNTISELANKCNQIEEVMNAIKSISDQTNLLALNAAIESARAGEHGRGFAVVADEVRKLAMKTRENAEQISDITASLTSEAALSVEQMSKCLEQAQGTVAQANEASGMMVGVVQSIQSIVDNMASVSSAANEQTTVSDSISQSTQSLASNSKHLQSSTAEMGQKFASMQQQITSLNQEMSRFEV
ncbi:methyl-accepting chemotaxis protein [Pseudoalteromonas phenolica]|uniref:Methyl-accepting chemotaxis protein n=1 Tax=Pseudoalteromonas phenolica TaxID=161398 RepID=A0A0S2K6X0_9GAMM|nr:methyl-accepting chemotaxis protein [Pseudoalteromonas phenolica]ALO44091.1 Methyl-accepting chemotaxis protein [Pseudoalteromonas phenolica]MBE0357074.1 methyl-accepting chemotaxis protein [Pseudoalteromonas phenolica O-BC30]RXE95715.1 methyl-accepting chemotaxis protein [Pseudoalteromonas phenolica O-BC30]